MSLQANRRVSRETSGRRGLSSFTLVELLVVVTILAVLSSVVGACLFGGMNVWDKAKRFTAVDSQVFPAIAAFERDAANILSFRRIKFAGRSDELSFPRLVPSREEGNGDSRQMRVAHIKFYFREGVLLRKQWVYPEGEPAGDFESERLATGIDSLRFEYLPTVDSSGNGASWTGNWENSTNLPAAVRMTVSAGGADGHQELVRTVALRRKGDTDAGSK